MATEYIPYHWLNISKCLRDHQGFLTDIGLGAFSHLGEMLRVALVAIIEPGRNRIAINESEGPFLAMGFMERKNLIDVISAINLAEEIAMKTVVAPIVDQANSNLPYSVFSPVLNNIEEVMNDRVKIKNKKNVEFRVHALTNIPFKLDQIDYLALKIIHHMDAAYENLQIKDYESALKKYSTIAFLYNRLRQIVFPSELTSTSIDKQVGILEHETEIRRLRAEKPHNDAIQYRALIRPFAIEVLLASPKEMRTSVDKAKNFTAGKLEAKLRASNIPELMGKELRVKSYVDLLNELKEEQQANPEQPKIFYKTSDLPKINKNAIFDIGTNNCSAQYLD